MVIGAWKDHNWNWSSLPSPWGVQRSDPPGLHEAIEGQLSTAWHSLAPLVVSAQEAPFKKWTPLTMEVHGLCSFLVLLVLIIHAKLLALVAVLIVNCFYYLLFLLLFVLWFALLLWVVLLSQRCHCSASQASRALEWGDLHFCGDANEWCSPQIGSS